MTLNRKEFLNKSAVYCFTNKNNNKKYIGASSSIYMRFNQHKQGFKGPTKFINAIKEFGFDNFLFEILEECEPSSLSEREKYWIAHYNATNDNFGYNTWSGKTGKRQPLTDKIKDKISLTIKKNHPEGYGGENNAFYGKKHSKEIVENMRKLAKERDFNPKPVIAFNEKDEKEFPSASNAGTVIGNRKGILHAIKNSKQYMGYSWRFK